ncbi:MAG: hypothetical protein A3F70_17325 [Acidobacteria bacterium RIFCSPLOWO2_12_FULL_67_14]|nr:MAG: hypothetical protein A3H29_07900 [Acidobacteria bacterium RIFCSPLOWO2_02_FULL_67_21]OFW35948.1 MAG: hypothetical protein A3F70_17325 [Acidobacteria bacterium RIFCSPLOWO2_12_FULL_67_14]
MRAPMPLSAAVLAAAVCVPAMAVAQAVDVLRVQVHSEGAPVSGAEVIIGGTTSLTGADGTVEVPVTPGAVLVTVIKEGFLPLSSTVDITPGGSRSMVFELEEQPDFEEAVIVTATRTDTRLEDQPMRVEVVPAEGPVGTRGLPAPPRSRTATDRATCRGSTTRTACPACSCRTSSGSRRR